MAIDNTHPTVTSMPNRASNAEVWIEWHKELKSYLGKRQANLVWVKAWQRRKGTNASTSALRDYMKSQGVEIDKSALEALTDTGEHAFDFVGDLYNAGKFFTIALGVIIVGGTGMVIYNLAKNPAKSAATVAKVMI